MTSPAASDGERGGRVLPKTLREKMMKCPQCKTNEAESVHSCPYQEEVNGDSTYTCKCCLTCECKCLEDMARTPIKVTKKTNRVSKKGCRKLYETVQYLGYVIKIYPPLSDFGHGPFCSVETASGAPIFGRSGLEATKLELESYIRRKHKRRKVRLPNGYGNKARSTPPSR